MALQRLPLRGLVHGGYALLLRISGSRKVSVAGGPAARIASRSFFQVSASIGRQRGRDCCACRSWDSFSWSKADTRPSPAYESSHGFLPAGQPSTAGNSLSKFYGALASERATRSINTSRSKVSRWSRADKYRAR